MQNNPPLKKNNILNPIYDKNRDKNSTGPFIPARCYIQALLEIVLQIFSYVDFTYSSTQLKVSTNPVTKALKHNYKDNRRKG